MSLVQPMVGALGLVCGVSEIAAVIELKWPRLLCQSQYDFSVDVLVSAGTRSGAGDGVSDCYETLGSEHK